MTTYEITFNGIVGRVGIFCPPSEKGMFLLNRDITMRFTLQMAGQTIIRDNQET